MINIYLDYPKSWKFSVRQWKEDFEKKTGFNLLDYLEVERRKNSTILDELSFIKKKSEGLISIIRKHQKQFKSPIKIYYNSEVLFRPTYVISPDTDLSFLGDLKVFYFRDLYDFENYVLNGVYKYGRPPND